MIYQFGKNPEYTISICWNVHTWGGWIALPFNICWWNNKDANGNRNIDISFWFLGIRFGIEIWRWKK